jgi:hypothetical protein
LFQEFVTALENWLTSVGSAHPKDKKWLREWCGPQRKSKKLGSHLQNKRWGYWADQNNGIHYSSDHFLQQIQEQGHTACECLSFPGKYCFHCTPIKILLVADNIIFLRCESRHVLPQFETPAPLNYESQALSDQGPFPLIQCFLWLQLLAPQTRPPHGLSFLSTDFYLGPTSHLPSGLCRKALQPWGLSGHSKGVPQQHRGVFFMVLSTLFVYFPVFLTRKSPPLALFSLPTGVSPKLKLGPGIRKNHNKYLLEKLTNFSLRALW